MVKILLEHGAGINLTTLEGSPFSSEPRISALSSARKGLPPGELRCWQDKEGKQKVIEYLLEQGAK